MIQTQLSTKNSAIAPEQKGTTQKIGAAATLLVVGIAALAITLWAASHFATFKNLTAHAKALIGFVGGGAVIAGALYAGLKVDTRPLEERLRDCLNCITFNHKFEANQSVKSKRTSVNDLCAIEEEHRLPELPGGRIMMINGVGGKEEKIQERLCALSTWTQKTANGKAYNVHAVWNATHGIATDLLEARRNIFGVEATEPSRLLAEAWLEFHDLHADDPDARILQICHSQGAAHVRNALLLVPAQIRARVEVVAIAPGAYIPEELCARVVHYRREGDPVPLLDGDGKKVAEDQGTVRVVERAKGAPKRFDHRMFSPSFEPIICGEISTFIQGREAAVAA